MIRFRRRLPPDLEARYRGFLAVNVEVEKAKELLIEVVPRARFPGRPVPEAVEGYVERLRRAQTRMASWHDGRLEAVWRACLKALEEGARRAERLRNVGGGLSFEALLEAVQEILDPLEAFEDADEEFRKLRRS